jgi:hypothetical protein
MAEDALRSITTAADDKGTAPLLAREELTPDDSLLMINLRAADLRGKM